MLVFLTILLLTSVLLLVVVILPYSWSLIMTRAPFVPIPAEVLPEIEQALRIRPGDCVYDLGCGDGRVIFHLAAHAPNAHFVGVEKTSFPFWLAKWQWVRHGRPTNVRLLKRNIFNTDLTSATHVFTYLFPKLMDDLLPKLHQELCPGARVVSCDFPFTNKKADAVTDLHRERKLGQKLYVYQF